MCLFSTSGKYDNKAYQIANSSFVLIDSLISKESQKPEVGYNLPILILMHLQKVPN